MHATTSPRAFLLLLSLLAACAGSGGGDDDSGPSKPACTPPSTGVTISYTANIQPIFDRSCAQSACHGSGLLGANLDLNPGKSYRQLFNIAAFQQPAKKRVLPGKPDDSYLVLKLEGTPGISGAKMPPAGNPPLPPDDIVAIRQWILECAPGPNAP